ncbi:MAG: fumarate hydratase C-terminal domain-containing protein [Actinomycetota bacterium]|nr:fumarate hydratase C-terminal domain-containing protein [Actinomycetota bacterium]
MKHIELPTSKSFLLNLRAGEEVLLRGRAYTLRDAALKRIQLLRSEGGRLPIEIGGELVFHAAPTPPAGGRPCAAIGPTTTSRMDIFLPLLLELEVAAILGKGPRGRDATRLHGEFGLVYFSAVGGLGALFGGKVSMIKPVAFEDLGPEAIHEVILNDFPAIVAIDSKGRDFFSEAKKTYGRQTPRGLD